MTDKAVLIEMLDRAKIEWSNVALYSNDKFPNTLSNEQLTKGGESEVIVYRGYSGFCVQFVFDKDESLIDCAAWE